MTWQGNWLREQIGYSDAKRVLEIGAGAYQTSIFLARRHPDKEVFGLDFVLSQAALKNLADAPPNLTVLKHDARTLPLISDGFFDMAFSVAVMEHIHELADHLREMHRIIRPGGHYCFWEAPFWSCSMGHHYEHSSPHCPVPHYAHLYLTRDELGAALKAAGQPDAKVSDIISRIYDRDDLSRLSRSQTKSIVGSSDFVVLKWEEDEDQHYTEDRADAVMNRNIFSISRDDLRIKGARVTLAKQ